jgi:hypothetical protein
MKLEELAKKSYQNNKYVEVYLLSENKQKSSNNKNIHDSLKIENNKKFRNVYELLIKNPNIKRVNEKRISLQW